MTATTYPTTRRAATRMAEICMLTDLFCLGSWKERRDEDLKNVRVARDVK